MFRTMVQFVLYTEDVNRETIEALARQTFDGFTLTFGRGSYGGQPEDSLAITVIGESAQSAALRCKAVTLAQRINRANNQHSVLVTETEIRGGFVLTRGADC